MGVKLVSHIEGGT